jgi:hypothetical protein
MHEQRRNSSKEAMHQQGPAHIARSHGTNHMKQPGLPVGRVGLFTIYETQHNMIPHKLHYSKRYKKT